MNDTISASPSNIDIVRCPPAHDIGLIFWNDADVRVALGNPLSVQGFACLCSMWLQPSFIVRVSG